MAWRKKAKAEESSVGPSSSPEEAQGEVVAVVREWEPHHDDSLPAIHAAIDRLGHGGDPTPSHHKRPVRDYAEVEAAVDRLTRRVKSRQVVVEETVTEYVEVAGDAPPAPGIETVPVPVPGARNASLAPPIDRTPKRRLAWFGPKSEKIRLAAEAPPASSTYQAQCGALTADGAQCRNSSREGSKYCASHKGYQPPTARGVAQRVEGAAWDPKDGVTDASSRRAADTKPRVRRAPDTAVATRKARKAVGRRPARKGARGKR